jgi:hypothetical protein
MAEREHDRLGRVVFPPAAVGFFDDRRDACPTGEGGAGSELAGGLVAWRIRIIAGRVRRSGGIQRAEAFGEGEKFEGGAVGAPGDAAVFEESGDRAVGGTAQGLDAVTDGERGGLPEGIDGGNHRVAVQHAGDVVGDGGGEFAAAHRREFGKNRVADSSADVGKSVAVEKKKWSRPVEMAEGVECLEEGGIGQAEAFPMPLARSSSLRINSVLRRTSLARCSVEADDKLPTPVFEKRGSAL